MSKDDRKSSLLKATLALKKTFHKSIFRRTNAYLECITFQNIRRYEIALAYLAIHARVAVLGHRFS